MIPRIESAMRSPARPFRSRSRTMVICFQLYLHQIRLPCAIGEGFVPVSERRTRLFCLSEFPGNNYYCLRIHKGTLEPKKFLSGS